MHLEFEVLTLREGKMDINCIAVSSVNDLKSKLNQFSNKKHQMMLSSTPKSFVAEDKEETQMEDESFKVVQLMIKMSHSHTNNKNLVKLLTVSDKYVCGLLVKFLCEMTLLYVDQYQ